MARRRKARTPWGWERLIPHEEATRNLPESSFVLVDGHRVHVERAGAGEPVLLLHGFAASSYSFRDLIPLLARDRSVIALDLYGAGYTERPPDSDAYTPAGQLRLITGVLDTLHIERCDVVGHSFGAALALLLAQEFPDRFSRLVLISPPTEFHGPPWFLRLPGAGRILYGLLRLFLSRPASFRKVLGRAFHRKEKLTRAASEQYRKRLLVDGLRFALRGFGKGMSPEQAPRFQFDHIKAPCLVMGGAHDTIVEPEACRRLAESLPRSQVVILEESGHSGPEEEPKEVAAAILGFRVA